MTESLSIAQRLRIEQFDGCSGDAVAVDAELANLAATQLEKQDRLIKEMHRLALVIESCVRYSEGTDHQNYKDVSALVRAISFLSKAHPNQIPNINERGRE